MDEEKEGDLGNNIEKKEKIDITAKIRENPWILSTIIAGALIVLMLVVNFSGMTGNVVSDDVAGEYLLSYLSNAGFDSFELKDIKTEGEFYVVETTYEGDDVPFYITKTGYIVGNRLVSIIPSASSSSSSDSSVAEDIPKTDKPEVELFVWGYCPYGVQAQGPLAEVASLLEDYADFETVLYYDGHGPFETQQNKIQECIQEVDRGKYWDYVAGFVEIIYPKCSSSRDVECDKTESIALMKSLGIDSTEVMSCVNTKGDDLFAEAGERAQQLGVTGSPTLVINGVKANTARTAEAYKTAVCDAFNNAPEECSTQLDSSAGTASGNC